MGASDVEQSGTRQPAHTLNPVEDLFEVPLPDGSQPEFPCVFVLLMERVAAEGGLQR